MDIMRELKEYFSIDELFSLLCTPDWPVRAPFPCNSIPKDLLPSWGLTLQNLRLKLVMCSPAGIRPTQNVGSKIGGFLQRQNAHQVPHSAAKLLFIIKYFGKSDFSPIPSRKKKSFLEISLTSQLFLKGFMKLNREQMETYCKSHASHIFLRRKGEQTSHKCLFQKRSQQCQQPFNKST